MMHGHHARLAFGVLTAIALSSGTGATSAAQSSATKAKKGSDVLMLNGCVTASADGRKMFTLVDSEFGQTYRLTGTDVRAYVGQHVEVLGAPRRGLQIVGGLYPSPNVAAQGGSIDPTKAAMAAHGAAGGSAARLVEFKVRSIRPTAGGCPEQ
jgi:hypothetical protein